MDEPREQASQSLVPAVSVAPTSAASIASSVSITPTLGTAARWGSECNVASVSKPLATDLPNNVDSRNENILRLR